MVKHLQKEQHIIRIKEPSERESEKKCSGTNQIQHSKSYIQIGVSDGKSINGNTDASDAEY